MKNKEDVLADDPHVWICHKCRCFYYGSLRTLMCNTCGGKGFDLYSESRDYPQ